MSELKPQYTESWPTWPTSLRASWSLSTLIAGRPDRPRYERVEASVRWELADLTDLATSELMPQYVEGSPRSDLATSELKPQYAERRPTWPTSLRASWSLSTLSRLTWPTSLRASWFLSTLRAGWPDRPCSERVEAPIRWGLADLTDLATSELMPQYAEGSPQSDLTTSELKPQYAESWPT